VKLHNSSGVAIVAGLLIDSSRNGKQIDVKGVWAILYPTLHIGSGIPIHASLGSQGFLSIPIYSRGRDQNIVELLRLHFWDKSLQNYPTYRKVNLFSIHSHQFHATSWILKGSITNTTFHVEPTEVEDEKYGYCFFNIQWDETKEYKSNLKKSFAVNSGRFVRVSRLSSTTYVEGQSYQIPCGDFHDSLVELEGENSITSTLFLFDAIMGKSQRSDVVGPANIKRNEVVRENNVDSMLLLEKLNTALNKLK
jgi:hypothetical protein